METPNRRAVPSVAETKRFLELYTGIQSVYDEVNASFAPVEGPHGFHYDPREVRAVIDLAYQNEMREGGAEPTEAERQHRQFVWEKIRWRTRCREEGRPKDSRFAAWRDRQIARTQAEFGRNRDDYFIHAPVMFELAEGCSVGCWFCAFSASKLANIVRYTPEDAKLWRETLETCVDVIGPGTRWSTVYFATDPLDNPDHELFCHDFHEVTGLWPQTTTAISHRFIERVRELIQLSRRKGCRVNRFSVLSGSVLRKLHEAFTPEELRDVELIIQSNDSTMVKAKVGRYVDKSRSSQRVAEREEQKNLNFLRESYPDRDPGELAEQMEDQPGSICCVSGFLINMAERTVKLITPVGADERWPLGIIVCDQREFADAADLRRVLGEMQAALRTELKPGDTVRFSRKLRSEITARGFRLHSPAGWVGMEFDEHAESFRTLGRLIQKGEHTAERICLLNAYANRIPSLQTMGILQEFFRRGLLDEEPEVGERTYYKSSGPQMIGPRVPAAAVAGGVAAAPVS